MAGVSEKIVDSVLYQHLQFDGSRRCIDWLRKAYHAYYRLRPFRQTRKLNKDYAFNRQLANQRIWIDGRYISKEEYMERMGLPRITFNTLGKNKRVIQGQYRNNDVAPICHAADPREKKQAEIWSELLKQNMKMNRRTEKDAKNFEEFLISGLPGYKVSFAHRKGKTDVWQDRVNPNLIFFPFTIADDLEDIGFIGMLHAFDFGKILSLFSHSPKDDEKLYEIYRHCNEDDYLASTLSTDSKTYDISATDFFTPSEYGKYRVIELWTLEKRRAYFVDDPREPNGYYVPYTKAEKARLDKINEDRLKSNIMMEADEINPMTDEDGNIRYFIEPRLFAEQNLIKYEYKPEEYWYYRYMTPDGYILEEGVSPYWNGGESMHPFILKPYPFVDGEIHSHVEEMRPAQDYLDYYVIQLDFYMRNAAKGVMVVDENSIGDMQSFEEMCDQFIRSNGVVLYTSKNGAKAPEIKTAGTIPGGFDYFIQLAKGMSEDVSGAQASLQGKKESGSMSGVLMAQLTQQAATSLADMMGTYNDFLEQVAMKTVKVMKCCYRGVKCVDICGEQIEVDVDTISDVDTNISISQNSNTATYQALTSDFVLNLAMNNRMPLEAAIEAADIPGGERILQIMEKYKQQIAKQQQAEAMAQQQQAAAQQVAQQKQAAALA